MKKIICLFLGIYVNSFAQNLVTAEYFVDTDPGVGLGFEITGLAGNQSSFTANIPTMGLTTGFHIIGFRAKTDDNKWGLYEKGMFYISGSSSNMTDITDAEYFIDTDLGVGNNIPISVADGQNPTFTVNVLTGSLGTGFHTIAIRAKDASGKWGLYEKGMFYISSSSANMPEIVDAEYFIDTDPGLGNGIAPMEVNDGQSTSFVVNIPTSTLINGFHTLAIRAKDAAGKWGLFEKGMFYISSSSTNMPVITDAEYFFDADPGHGNGTAIGVDDGGSPSFTANILTNSLSIGFHTVSIRAKDAAGNWGLFDKGLIYISPIATNAGDMTKGEYFIDNDPGPGNGFPINIPVGQAFAQNFVLNVPRTLMDGEHILAIRMFDDWGLTDTKTFVVDGVALPLQLIDFSAKKEEKSVKLDWKTANEVNTSHFEIERSSGQINFVKIGRVEAINSKENQTYDFMDDLVKSETEGVFYYRLKMVDLDGKYSYSPIRSLLFENEDSEFSVFPSPAEKSITIDLKKTYPRIKAEIFNSNGKEMNSNRFAEINQFEMNVENLPTGIYFIRITQGADIKQVKFLKR
jgi:Secretion system C-terminal sorting domain